MQDRPERASIRQSQRVSGPEWLRVAQLADRTPIAQICRRKDRCRISLRRGWPLIRAKQKRAERRRDARVSSRADGSTARRPRSQPRERDTLGRRGVLSPTWPCGIVSGRCRMRTWRSCAVSPRRSTPVISTGTTASSLIHWSNGRRRGKIQTPQPSPADWYLAINFTIRDGKVVRGEEYFDRDEALEAAGLSEQDAHADC